MRKLLLVMFAAFILTGCGASPKSVVEDYFVNLDNGEINAAYELMSEQLVYKAGERKVKAILTEQAKRMQNKGGLADIDVEGEAKGEIGQYTAHLVFEDESKQDENVNVVKEDGDWKISLR